jgi:hypothetical protein
LRESDGHLTTVRHSRVTSLSSFSSVWKDGGCANLDPHRRVAEGSNAQARRDGSVVGRRGRNCSVSASLISSVCPSSSIWRDHKDHVLPAHARDCQGAFDITQRLGNFLPDRLRELPIIVPVTLPSSLQPIAGADRPRIVIQTPLTFTVYGSDKEHGRLRNVPRKQSDVTRKSTTIAPCSSFTLSMPKPHERF